MARSDFALAVWLACFLATPSAAAQPATEPPPATPDAPTAAEPAKPGTAKPTEATKPEEPAAAEAKRPQQPEAKAPAIKGMVDGEDEAFGARTLKGHTFQLPLLNDTPFVPTYFGVGTELGLYRQPGIEIRYQDETGANKKFTYDTNAAFIRERFGLGFGILDVVQLGVEADYTGVVGTNAETIFLFGGQTAFDIRPGVRVRLLRLKSTGTQIGVHGYAILGAGIELQPQGLLVEIARDLAALAASDKRTRCLIAGNFRCAFPKVDVFGSMEVKQSNFGGGASVSAAQAIGRHLGVQGAVGVDVTKPEASYKFFGSVTSTAETFYVGVAPTLNLSPIVPLAALLEYRFELHNAALDPSTKAGIPKGLSETNINHGVAAGIFHAGRRDLMLGLIFNGNFLRQSAQIGTSSSEAPAASILTAQFTMRYFF